MAISVSNLSKNNGIWSYDYTYDQTQKQLINDEFFNVIGFTDYIVSTNSIKTWLFSFCDSTDHEALELSLNALGCLQSFSASINEGWKFAQHNYRYYHHDFGWMHTDIYRDVIRMTISIKATSDKCEIIEIDNTALVIASLELIRGVLGDEYDVLLTEISEGTIYVMSTPQIEVGIINEAFNKLSMNFEAQIIPKNFKRAIDNKSICDISLECSVDGRLVIGRVSANEKKITALGVMFDRT